MKKPVILKRILPSYFQSAKDNSCGPQVIRIVADYYKAFRRKKLVGEEWQLVLRTTMNGNIERSMGTTKKDLKKALGDLGLLAKELRGGDKNRLTSIELAIRQNHPIIVSCRIPYRGKPVAHYAILAGMDEDCFYVRDPFPHRGKRSKAYRSIPKDEFLKRRSGKKETVWGRLRWGIEVFPKKRDSLR